MSSKVVIEEAEACKLEPCVELIVTCFFGELGNDYGFNNNRAVAHQELCSELRADLWGLLAHEESINLLASSGEDVVGFVRVRRSRPSDPAMPGQNRSFMMLDNLAVVQRARQQGIAAEL
ncbi:MAG: hypothetical protein SGPRY_012880, partial [Prymnesium sp.]